jgi:hypothetical protein
MHGAYLRSNHKAFVLNYIGIVGAIATLPGFTGAESRS